MSYVGFNVFFSIYEKNIPQQTLSFRLDFEGFRPIRVFEGVAQQEHVGFVSAVNGLFKWSRLTPPYTAFTWSSIFRCSCFSFDYLTNNLFFITAKLGSFKGWLSGSSLWHGEGLFYMLPGKMYDYLNMHMYMYLHMRVCTHIEIYMWLRPFCFRTQYEGEGYRRTVLCLCQLLRMSSRSAGRAGGRRVARRPCG